MNDWIVFPVTAPGVIGIMIMGIGLCGWSDDEMKRDHLRTLRDVGAGFAVCAAILEAIIFIFG